MHGLFTPLTDDEDNNGKHYQDNAGNDFDETGHGTLLVFGGRLRDPANPHGG